MSSAASTETSDAESNVAAINKDSSEKRLPSESTMQAIFNPRYGSPDDLKLCDIDKPIIRDDEILVRVHAAGLHIGDSFGVRGKPLLMRMATGFFKPTYGVPGFDVAGVVENIGSSVTRFKSGDEVYGECAGSCAEYVAVHGSKLAAKPANLTLEEAAAIPTSGLAALHALRDVAKIEAGQSILINGASGGVGTFAVQIAKYFGAEVTGVCSTSNVEMVRSIGAHQVIDYTKSDFARSDTRYDVIFDNIENRSLKECRNVLKPDGILILNSGTGATGLRMMDRLLRPLLFSPFVRQNLRRYLSVPNHEDLEALKTMVESGAVTPVIDREYSLEETSSAIRYIEDGHVKGKVVVATAGRK